MTPLIRKSIKFTDGVFHNTINNDYYARFRYIRATYPSWQYNGCAKFNVITDWCHLTLGDDCIWDSDTIYFRTAEGLLFFKLRWS
jgi:hypothetical protein